MLDLPQKTKTVKTILLIIVAIAAVIRILYLIQVYDDVLLRMVIKSESFDESRFISSASQIVSGNWLASKVYYSLGYSYVISFLYLFLPKDITTIFLFQIILGVIAVYVLYRAAALLFNDKKAGLIAALIAALYSPFVFQECDIERGAIIAYCNLFCFYLLLRALKKDKIKYFFFSGLLLGLSMVIRPNILSIFLVPYIFFTIKNSFKVRIWSVMVFILGIMVLVTSIATRNLIQGQGFTIEPQGIEAFWVGNAHDSPGVDLAWLNSQKELTKESGNSIAKAFTILGREIKKYPEEYRQLYFRKIKMFLNGYEVPSNINFYLFKERYPILNICFFNFTIIAPLALAGIFLARRKYRLIGLLYIFLFVLSFSNIAFHIQGRYRIPAIPFFIILASYAVYWLSENVMARKWLLAGGGVLAIGCISFYTRPDYSMIKKYSGAVIRSNDYANLAGAYLGKLSEKDIAIEQKEYFLIEGGVYLEKAIKVNPLNMMYYEQLVRVYATLGEYPTANYILSIEKKIYDSTYIHK